MNDLPDPRNDGTRYFGSGLIRSGDQGMLVRGIGRGLQTLTVGLLRDVRYVYEGIRRVISRRPGA